MPLFRPGLAAAALLLACLPLPVLPAGAAAAQAELPVDPLVGIYERELRSLRGKALSDPAAAARDASALPRRLANESGGVGFSADRTRIDRGLGRLTQDATPAPTPEPLRSLEATEPGLPSSYDDDPDDLPSARRRSLRLVGRLLDRAEAGIAAREIEQVRSDLAAAGATLVGLLGEPGPEGDARPLGRRLTDLERRAAAAARSQTLGAAGPSDEDPNGAPSPPG